MSFARQSVSQDQCRDEDKTTQAESYIGKH